jgi:thymidylate synthase (FAD)
LDRSKALKLVTPKITLIGRPTLDYDALMDYLKQMGVSNWNTFFGDSDGMSDAEWLIEVAGRNCYKSWEPGLNKNVTKIRSDHAEYLLNILRSGHGSVLEHATWNFIIDNVSRVFTHEIVRHRVGTAISQESLRYVRLDDLDFWMPEWAVRDKEIMDRAINLIYQMEEMQRFMAKHFKLDDPGVPFAEKKEKTSFMRRFAPEGLGTRMIWSANARTLRHVIEMRTPMAAEEEMRLVARELGHIMKEEAPLLFGDYSIDDNGGWVTQFKKV